MAKKHDVPAFGERIVPQTFWAWWSVDSGFRHAVTLYDREPTHAFDDRSGRIVEVELVAAEDCPTWDENGGWWAHPPFNADAAPEISWTIRWAPPAKRERAVRILIRTVAPPPHDGHRSRRGWAVAKSFSIAQFIDAAGIDNVSMQFLRDCMTRVTTNKRGRSTVTFVTEQLTAADVGSNTGPVGVVLWVSREGYARAQRAAGFTPKVAASPKGSEAAHG